MQNMASRHTTEDPILVLQAHHVDVVEVEECCRLFIRSNVILGERPAHARRVVVPLVRVVHRERQQASIPILCGNGTPQLARKRGDSPMTLETIPDYPHTTR